MSEQEKKRKRIYDLLNAETKPFFTVFKAIFFFNRKRAF